MSPSEEPLLQDFEFDHLPAGLMRDTSSLFSDLAHTLCAQLPPSADRTHALRSLLAGKDTAVRAARKHGLPEAHVGRMRQRG